MKVPKNYNIVFFIYTLLLSFVCLLSLPCVSFAILHHSLRAFPLFKDENRWQQVSLFVAMATESPSARISPSFWAVKCLRPSVEQGKSVLVINIAIKSAGVCVCVFIKTEKEALERLS